MKKGGLVGLHDFYRLVNFSNIISKGQAHLGEGRVRNDRWPKNKPLGIACPVFTNTLCPGQGGLLNKVLLGKAPLQGPVRGEV